MRFVVKSVADGQYLKGERAYRRTWTHDVNHAKLFHRYADAKNALDRRLGGLRFVLPKNSAAFAVVGVEVFE